MTEPTGHQAHAQAVKGLVTDPVCGMQVDPATATQKSIYAGETHFFCSPGCRTKFEAEPKRYLKAAPAAHCLPANWSSSQP